MMKRWTSLLFLLLPVQLFPQEGTFVSTATEKKNVLFEEYTGVSCGNCPRAHALENEFQKTYAGKFFAVNIHAGSLSNPYHAGDPWLTVGEGEALNDTFAINSYPSGVVNRHKFGRNYAASESKWQAYIDSVTAENAVVNVAAQGQIDGKTRVLTLRVQLYYTSDEQRKNYLHLALTQDRILAAQSDYNDYNPSQTLPDGNYIHMHAFRGYIAGGLEGEEIAVEKGKVIEKTFTYTLPDSIKDIPVTLPELHVVAFVTSSPLYEVLNVCEAELEWVNFPENVVWLCDPEESPVLSCDPVTEAGFSVENVLGQDIDTLTYSVALPQGSQVFTHVFEPALKAGEKERIPLEKFPLTVSNRKQTISVKAVKINGKPYSYAHGSTLNLVVIHNRITVPTEEVRMDFCQDSRGEEITWKIVGLDGETLYSGGPYENLDERGQLSHYIDMKFSTKGCFFLAVYDAGGDGIRGTGGNGYISMTDAFGHEFYNHKGRYGDSLVIAMDTRSVAVEKTEGLSFKLYPNPAAKEVFIEADGNYAVSVYTLSGTRVLSSETLIGSRTTLCLETLCAGVYIVELRRGLQTGYQKLIVR